MVNFDAASYLTKCLDPITDEYIPKNKNEIVGWLKNLRNNSNERVFKNYTTRTLERIFFFTMKDIVKANPTKLLGIFIKKEYYRQQKIYRKKQQTNKKIGELYDREENYNLL